MDPRDFPAPTEGFVLTHFLVVSDQDRSREFYQSLFGGTIVVERDPVIMMARTLGARTATWSTSWLVTAT
jgi:hypothetical protein